MRFLSIICLAGMCGVAITMLFHLSSADVKEDERKFWFGPYLVCLIIVLLGGIGWGLTWNAERNRAIQVERMKISYEKSHRK